MPDTEDAEIAATPLGGQVDEAERQRRDFIRAHHPDRGGDPDVFVAGLRSFAMDQEGSPRPGPRVVVVRRRLLPIRVVIAVTRRLRPGRRPPRVH